MMKKFLIVVILMMSAACAEAKNISIDNFIYRFNSVPGHSLSKQSMQFTSGAINDSYMINYAECLNLSLFVKHGTPGFVQGYVLYGGDKIGSYAEHALVLMGELFYAAGAIDDVSETMAVLKKLGLNNLQSDTTNSIIRNGWKLFLTSNSLFGIMCGVEKP